MTTMNQEKALGCVHVDEDLPVRYVRGDLDDLEQARFEDHYFECAACLQAVQALQAGARVLAGGRKVTAARPARPRVPAWAMAAGIAAMAVGTLVTLRATGIVTPAPSPGGATPTPGGDPYAELARVEAAPYAPLAMRGTSAPDRLFADAMRKYVQSDFAGAAEGLRAALGSGADTPEARFYLGVSELMAGRPGAAADELRRATGPAAEPALALEAHFYLAKALLAGRKPMEAEAELRAVAAAGGERAAESRQLLQRIDAVGDRSR